MPSTCSFFQARGHQFAGKVLVPWAKLPGTDGRGTQTADKAQRKDMGAWTANCQWLSKRMEPGSLLPKLLLNWSLCSFMRFAMAMTFISQDLALCLHMGCGWCTETGCQILCEGSAALQLSAEWHNIPWWDCGSLLWSQHVVKPRILRSCSRTVCSVFTGTAWPRAGSSFGSALACSHPASHCWNMPRSSWRHVRKKRWPWSAAGGFRQWWGKWHTASLKCSKTMSQVSKSTWAKTLRLLLSFLSLHPFLFKMIIIFNTLTDFEPLREVCDSFTSFCHS